MLRKTKYLMAFMLFFGSMNLCFALSTKGIYLTQSTLENPYLLNQLISESKQVGINTFVVDCQKKSKRFKNAIKLIKDHGIKPVARIVVFPDGATPAQMKSVEHWESRYQLVEAAIDYGVEEIQLDYIRYSTKNLPADQNAHDVKAVINWYKQRLVPRNIPLQIDVFGEASFKPSTRIGQNIPLFAPIVDSISPMVYPSHYVPYQQHFDKPYYIVYDSLMAIKKQFPQPLPFKLVPFIEASNYHYRMSHREKMGYVLAQIKAAEDANADGWFVWSANNHYRALFQALKTR